MIKPSIDVLNIKATNGCNLSCRGCSHQSQWAKASSRIDIDNLITDIYRFADRVNVNHHVSLLGGEVLLEPKWSKLLTAIEDVFLDKCQVRFYTNGILLHKHKDQILHHLKRGSKLRISVHEAPHTTRGKLIMDNINDFVDFCHEGGLTEVKGYGVAFSGESDLWDIPDMVSYSRNFTEMWSDTFKFDNGKILPYNSKNIQSSYQNCVCANVQLYQGRLWKCAQSAYLRDTLNAFGQLDNPEWKRYLNYKGVSLSVSDEELLDFCDTQYNPSWICSMCPEGGNYHPREQQKIKKLKIIPMKVV